MMVGIAHAGVAQPIERVHTDLAERIVDHAVAGLEQIAPDHGDGDQGGDHRREQRGAEEGLEARQARMQQQGRAER